MGSMLSSWWWGGDPDEVNPLSGMSIRQVYAVQKTWAVVYADAGKYGIELFVRLFRADPESKTFFKAIQKLSEEELSKSYQFKAHAINLMSAINMAVLNLKQPEVVIAMMDKLGESHAKRKVLPRHFNEARDVLVKILRDDLKLNGEQLEAWSRFVDFIYKHIFARLD